MDHSHTANCAGGGANKETNLLIQFCTLEMIGQLSYLTSFGHDGHRLSFARVWKQSQMHIQSFSMQVLSAWYYARSKLHVLVDR